MEISEHEKNNIGQILISDEQWFGALLIRLIAKADFDNKVELYTIYPSYVNAVHKYQTNKLFSEDLTNEAR